MKTYKIALVAVLTFSLAACATDDPNKRADDRRTTRAAGR